MTESVVRVSGLTKTYVQGEITVTALGGVDLTLNPGEFVSMAGPSGSGKSTLLNLIGVLDRPTAGEVWIGSERVDELDPSAAAELRLSKIGFVFQAYNLIPVLSALENVEFTMQLQGVPTAERRERAHAMLAAVGLGELADRRPSDMSGGQQQRVAVARALVTEPLLLLADEPSANLDSDTTRSLLALLQDLNSRFNTTILTATHDPVVMEYAARHITLRDGKIETDSAHRPAA